MLKFLNTPYPFNDNLRHNAKIIFFISLGVLAFLLLFQPIELRSLSSKEMIYLVSGLAASTFLVLTLSLIILPSLFPKLFDKGKWNIKKEILWNLWILLAISSSDLLFYTKLFGVMDIYFSDIGKIILLGILPVSVLITVNQNRILKSNLESAKRLNKRLVENKQEDAKLIYFESDYKKDSLTIKPDLLMLIKSADNYIEVFYEREGQVLKKMIRSSLKNAQMSVEGFDFICKCHRSFIVNVQKISEIQGSYQGYELYFENLDFPAQVSQKYIADFNEVFNKYHLIRP